MGRLETKGPEEEDEPVCMSTRCVYLCVSSQAPPKASTSEDALSSRVDRNDISGGYQLGSVSYNSIACVIHSMGSVCPRLI